MALCRSLYGVGDFTVFELNQDIQTPEGAKPISLRAAVAWVDSLQVELIEPISGYIGHYLACLPKAKMDDGLHFHHVAVRRDDLTRMRAEIDLLGLPIICECAVAGVVFVYVDSRKSLGHILEFVWATPKGWAMQAWPASRPLSTIPDQGTIP